MNRPRLTARQRCHLQDLLHHCREARFYRRLLAILQWDQGQSITQIAQGLGVTRQSVYHWLQAYSRTGDPLALAEGDHPGRPPRCTAAIQGLLRHLLADSPQRYGYFAVDWTIPLLQEHLARCTGEPLSQDTLRRQLHLLGYVWKRSRYALDPDPELEKKTADSSPPPAAAAPERHPRRGRDRPPALPPAPGRWGAEG